MVCIRPRLRIIYQEESPCIIGGARFWHFKRYVLRDPAKTMKILMCTNTYLPHVGGVARSVEAFAAEYRRRGNEILIVAPRFRGAFEHEEGVIRVPAIQNFNGSDFSVKLPLPGYLQAVLRDFNPELVHSHHPFLLGDTALRVAAEYDVPLVFQHHTMYERYTHYVPGDSPTLKQFVVDLATEYANLCEYVFAPSESVRAVLLGRGVETPIEVVPTGVDPSHFAKGNRLRLRRELDIPEEAFVVGYLGRLAPEKNLPFLAEAVARFLENNANACFFVVGEGPSREGIERIFQKMGLQERLFMAGTRQGQDLVDAYHAMDVFAFASQSETQGMVLTEAMAAGCPVVGVDAPGVREVVEDAKNGRLITSPKRDPFAGALAWVAELEQSDYEALRETARATAKRFSMENCSEKALKVYRNMLEFRRGGTLAKNDWEKSWHSLLRRAELEWSRLSARTQAAGKAVFGMHSSS